jgi:hypothetical protein
MTATTATQCQHSTGMVRTPPPVVEVRATLVVAHRLLNNPPSTHASSSATEQWRHDIDQLIIVAINTSHHEGGQHGPSAVNSRSPSSTRAPPSACMPHQSRVSLSIATADLRNELIHRHRGQDSRITIECHHERRHNIEGCNLERDFESLAPTREAYVACVMHPLAPQQALGGCMALAPHLRMVVWPHKFQPHLPEKYDETVNPAEFLQMYSTSILTIGGDEAIMDNYFPAALTGTA